MATVTRVAPRWARAGRRAAARALAALGLLGLGCQLEPPSPEPSAASPAAGRHDQPFAASDASDAGAAALFPLPRSFVTWNLQWFLDPERGPKDDARQLAGARAVLSALSPDVIALQEITSPVALDALLDDLGLRAAAITGFAWPQQLAIALAPALQAGTTRVLEELSSAGRAPLEAELFDAQSGARVVAIVVHAKAQADAASWEERRALAEGLRAYLRARWPDTPVIVLGDLNDGLSRSITAGKPSPYAAFVSDPSYAAPTLALEQAEPTRSLLDHVLLSDELASELVDGATERIEVSELPEAPAASAISDHSPIRVTLGVPPSAGR